MAFNTKSIYFPEDIFKHIISYTESLPKCDAKKCRCVATAECARCANDCCKKHMETNYADVDNLCKDCVKRGYEQCYNCLNYGNMDCDNCTQVYCLECCARDEDGDVEAGLCCGCGSEHD